MVSFDLMATYVNHLCICLSPIVVLLNILVVSALYSLQQKKHSPLFFDICLVGGIIDILAISNLTISCMLPQSGFLTNVIVKPETANIIVFLLCANRSLQYFTVLFISLNRIFAIKRPLGYETLSSSAIRILIFPLQMTLSLLYGTGTSKYSTLKWIKLDSNGGFTPDIDFTFGMKICHMVITVSFLLAITFSYWRICSFARIHKKTIVCQLQKAKQETNLNKITIVICSIELVSFCIIFSHVILDSPIVLRYTMYNVVSVISTCTPPILLLLYSSQVKERVQRWLEGCLWFRIDRNITITPIVSIYTSIH